MYLTKARDIRRIGFVSTRLQGTDGVSLETRKWDDVLTELGYETFFFSGLSDWYPERSRVVPAAYFLQPEVHALHKEIFRDASRRRGLTADVGEIKGGIKAELYKFIEDFGVDLIIPENALAIPMHIPLGLAITELIAETEMPTIAHHHDFFWERPRFLTGCAEDYLGRSFPPKLHSIAHVVINTEARQQLAFRCGLSSFMIPNVWDFDEEPVRPDDYNAGFRKDFGLTEDEVIFLQPTRIVARKGIENAIELVARYNKSKEGAGRGRLLISHPELDEGNAYFNRITDYAALLEVPLLIRPDLLAPERGTRPDGGRVYSLWDAYVACDFVTYPSTYEGFGNAFLEAVYYRKPILVNQYAIYAQDIDPIGFKVVSIDGFITRDTVRQTIELLADPSMREDWAEHNFRLGRRFFSYDILRKRLPYLFMNFGVVS